MSDIPMTAIKPDSVHHAFRAAYWVEDIHVIVDPYVLCFAVITSLRSRGVPVTSQLPDSFSKWDEEVFPQESKLNIQIMFNIIVPPIDHVSADEWSCTMLEVLFLRNDANVSEVYGWIAYGLAFSRSLSFTQNLLLKIVNMLYLFIDLFHLLDNILFSKFPNSYF